MAKPTKLPVWATDLSNVTEPASGQKDTGWTNNQPAISSYFNWLFYTIYLWLAYIDAGVFDGPITVDGNLSVTGNTFIDGYVDINNVRLTSLGSNLSINKSVSIIGTLEADELIYSERRTVPAVITSASTDVALATNDPLTVSSTSNLWWYYTPALPLSLGDTLDEVFVKFNNNVFLSPVNVEVGYCKNGVVTYSSPASSSLGNGTITDLLGYKIELTGGVVDTVHIRVSGTSNGIDITNVDYSVTHGA